MPEGEIEYVPFPQNRLVIDIGDYRADYSRIKAKLGWEPKISFEEGLSRTLAYYRENQNQYWE